MTLPSINALRYWLRRTLNLPITWHCTRKSTCYHHREDIYIDHSSIHAFCTHCTNPLIQCRKCGAHYIDRNAPNPERWKYLGLWGGWEHAGSCAVRGPWN